MRSLRIWLAAFGWVLTATPAVAHHGSAIFDLGRTLTMQATVVEWTWTNPHCYLKFDVTEGNGRNRHWIAETTSPSRMLAMGWMKSSLAPGDRVTIAVVPVKDGRPAGRVVRVTLPDGTVLSAQ